MSRPVHLSVLLELHRRRVPHILVGAMAVMQGIDLMLEARPYPFSRWWARRRLFRVEGGSVVCADLEMVLEAKRQAGRPKDEAFLLSYYARNPRPRPASSPGAGPRRRASRRRRPAP